MGKVTIGTPKSSKTPEVYKEYIPEVMSNKDHRARRLIHLLSRKLKQIEKKPAQIIKEIETIVEKQPIQQIINEQTDISNAYLSELSELKQELKFLKTSLNNQKDVIEDVQTDEHNDSVHIEGLENKIIMLEHRMDNLESIPANISQITRVEYKTNRALICLSIFSLLISIITLIVK
jgi:hypothetical protein